MDVPITIAACARLRDEDYPPALKIHIVLGPRGPTCL